MYRHEFGTTNVNTSGNNKKGGVVKIPDFGGETRVLIPAETWLKSQPPGKLIALQVLS